MLNLSKTLDTAISIESATARLTETILGNDDHDLAETLRTIASDIGLSHISYVRLSPDKSPDMCLLVAVVTYSRLWQHRYFVKKYMSNDPVIFYGRASDHPFDWSSLPVDDPATKSFFADALNHSVGRNGLTIPLRNRRGVCALVSFTSDLPTDEWEAYKAANMAKLKLLSVLIDSASHINFKLPAFPVHLSNREEQCLLWAARGKTYQEIAEILGLAFGSVKTHLDAARHKLHCMNLTHAAAVAFATGVIPAQALK
jgi:DNA-binding CsgD family transcriptional regulator